MEFCPKLIKILLLFKIHPTGKEVFKPLPAWNWFSFPGFSAKFGRQINSIGNTIFFNLYQVLAAKWRDFIEATIFCNLINKIPTVYFFNCKKHVQKYAKELSFCHKFSFCKTNIFAAL